MRWWAGDRPCRATETPRILLVVSGVAQWTARRLLQCNSLGAAVGRAAIAFPY
jgi:hypothetical protein